MMNRLKVIFLTTLCLVSAGVTRLGAQGLHQTQMPFQGYLTDDTGAPLTDTVSIEFKLYRGFSLIWTESQDEVPVVDGVFSVELGSVNPLTDVRFQFDFHLGISVNGDPEMIPRTDLTAVPYAMNLRGAIRVQPISDDGAGVYYADNIIGGMGHVPSGVVAATIGGGGDNDAIVSRNQVYGDFGTVGGGRANAAGGGDFNIHVGLHSPYATVGGGYYNIASGSYASIPGGYWNWAFGNYSFAAGYRARAEHAGSFVWADSTLDTDFVSTDENQFLIRAAGGVGIGTATPKQGLSISRDVEAPAYQLELRNVGNISLGSFDGIAFTQTGSGATELASMKVIYHTTGYPDMSFSVRNAADALFIESSTGDVGIGTTAPTVALDVNGEIKAPTITETSDARMKRNVTPIHNALSLVTGLQGVSFDWDREAWPDRNFGPDRQIGLIAQEVERVVPEVVRQGDDGYYSVAYSKLVPLLIEAIKEQQAHIAGQDQTIDAQNERIATLERRMMP